MSKVRSVANFAVSAMFLIAGGFLLADWGAFSAHSVETTATVTGSDSHVWCPGHNCRTVYQPKVRFTDSSGQEIYTTLADADDTTEPEVGEAIGIKYRSDRPYVARRTEDTGFPTVFAILFAIGLVSQGLYLRRLIKTLDARDAAADA